MTQNGSINLALDREESEVLRGILDRYLATVRHAYGEKENANARPLLDVEEEVIERVLERLEALAVH